MSWRARKNISRLSNTVPKQHEAPVLLFVTGLPEIRALISNAPVVGCEATV
jgi:hypothetical protein